MQATSRDRPPVARADAERNRQRLLEAALELFAERGIDVSLAAIARHAGVGVATAYRHYPQREELIDALFELRGAELVAIVERERGCDDPAAAIERILEQTIALQEQNRGLKQLVFGGPHGRHYHEYLRDQIAAPLRELVASAQAQGKLRPDVVPTDLPVIELMLGAVTEFDVPPEFQLWRRHLRIVLDGLCTPTPSPLPGQPLGSDEMQRVIRTLPAPQPPSR